MDEERKDGQSTVDETQKNEAEVTKQETKTDHQVNDGKDDTQSSEKKDVEKTKTFTQEELDNIVVTRLAKERQKIMKKLGIDDEGQIDEYVKRFQEYDTIKNENEALKNEKEKFVVMDELRNMGVDPDFLDYVYTKVERGEKFKENAQEFLKTNPKLLAENYQKVNSGLDLDGNQMPDLESMSTAEYLAWRAKNKL